MSYHRVISVSPLLLAIGLSVRVVGLAQEVGSTPRVSEDSRYPAGLGKQFIYRGGKVLSGASKAAGVEIILKKRGGPIYANGRDGEPIFITVVVSLEVWEPEKLKSEEVQRAKKALLSSVESSGKLVVSDASGVEIHRASNVTPEYNEGYEFLFADPGKFKEPFSIVLPWGTIQLVGPTGSK